MSGIAAKAGILLRAEQTLDAVLKTQVEAALTDPAPSLLQAEVSAALRARHATRSAA